MLLLLLLLLLQCGTSLPYESSNARKAAAEVPHRSNGLRPDPLQQHHLLLLQLLLLLLLLLLEVPLQLHSAAAAIVAAAQSLQVSLCISNKGSSSSLEALRLLLLQRSTSTP